MKERVVVLGAAGFVGSAIASALGGGRYQLVAVSRKDCDFTDTRARETVRDIVRDGDIVVCAAAKAPAKNLEALTENVILITNIAEALRKKRLAYLLNIGSDAIYADSAEPIDESAVIEPGSPHGIMHCMREYILEHRVRAPIGHLRPTLIYGENDPHNGYGPNAFIRSALASRRIELFGNGEERRDHIYVGDVVALAIGMIDQKAAHAVNAVTGTTISFMDIAQLIRKASASPVEIMTKPRSGPMPHNGYRAFSNEAARNVSPGRQFTDIADYIRERVGATKHAA